MKTTASYSHRRREKGYSLLELAIATGVLAAGISAAASLTMTSVRMEEMSHRKARVLSMTEAAARLWQLGVSTALIAEIIPGDPALSLMSFNAQSGDPVAVAPTDKGTPIADPAADLGNFQSATIRASVLMRDGDTASAAQDLPPLTVIR